MRLIYASVEDMLHEFMSVSGQLEHKEKYQDTYVSLIKEEAKEFLEAVETGDEGEIFKELADLVYVAYGYAVTKGFPLDHALYLVHKNNMGRMYQPDGSIKYREDGKVLKNKDYPKVDLSKLIKGE